MLDLVCQSGPAGTLASRVGMRASVADLGTRLTKATTPKFRIRRTSSRNDRLQSQIVGLERRTSAVGRDTISHPDRGHDDVANAVAGAAALSKFGGYDTSLRWVSGDDDHAWTAKTPGWVPLIGI